MSKRYCTALCGRDVGRVVLELGQQQCTGIEALSRCVRARSDMQQVQKAAQGARHAVDALGKARGEDGAAGAPSDPRRGPSSGALGGDMHWGPLRQSC